MGHWKWLWCGLVLAGAPVYAQHSSKVKALEKKKMELKKQVDRSKTDLNQTRRNVDTKIKTIDFLGVQLESRLKHIAHLEKKMAVLDRQISGLAKRVALEEQNLEETKKRYKKTLIYSRTNQAVQSPLLFIFSAKSVTQMFRRARYAREYASYQVALGEQIKKKQAELLRKQGKLLQAKGEMSRLVRETLDQRKELFAQQQHQQKVVAGLQQHEKVLVKQLEKHQQELQALDKKIDELIAAEIEAARKRAAEAARRAAEKKRREEVARRKAAKNAKKTKTEKVGSAAKELPDSWQMPVDQVLSSHFERNKGRLPVPITGSYMIGNRFGTYQVPGLRNVRLDNKGVNYVGKQGARARAIFDGEVTAVFQFGGTTNVLIRHGNFISVYCNLSSVIVSKGQKVHTRDLIGAVADDGSGHCTLHFQLRKEKQKLNPEVWISK